jgi:hypothetical protein
MRTFVGAVSARPAPLWSHARDGERAPSRVARPHPKADPSRTDPEPGFKTLTSSATPKTPLRNIRMLRSLQPTCAEILVDMFDLCAARDSNPEPED